jgi:hypothetical protein
MNNPKFETSNKLQLKQAIRKVKIGTSGLNSSNNLRELTKVCNAKNTNKIKKLIVKL